MVVDPVTTYAPTVRLHPKERNFPGSTGAFLAASRVQYWPKVVRFSPRGIPKSCKPTTFRGKPSANRLGGAAVHPYRTRRRTYQSVRSTLVLRDGLLPLVEGSAARSIVTYPCSRPERGVTCVQVDDARNWRRRGASRSLGQSHSLVRADIGTLAVSGSALMTVEDAVPSVTRIVRRPS